MALDVEEKLLRLVPAVEHADARRALAACVRRDDDRHLRPACPAGVRGAQGLGHMVGAVEDREIHSWIEDRLRKTLGAGELFDLEVATAEQKPSQAKEARVSARHEHAGAWLVDLVIECVARTLGTRVYRTARRPGDTVADLESPAPAFAGGHLDDLSRAAAGHG